MKQNLFILISIMLSSGVALAQPGWQDFTARYYYTILDKAGNVISFRNNKNYSLILDNILYKAPNIPNDSLKRATSLDKGSQSQIRINDFSLAIPQKETRHDQRLEIKIIHGEDTMYISQPSGTGSFGGMFRLNLKNKEPVIPPADITLRFIAGHYYFPHWTKNILENLPETSGDVQIVNIDQRNFIVPEHIYDSFPHRMDRQEQFKESDDFVLNNFMNRHFSVEKRIERTKYNKIVSPYKNPGFPGFFSPTHEPDRFFGMIRYSMNYKDCFSGSAVFSILNIKENTIEQFFPKENPRLFNGDELYVDTFNTIFYLPVIIKRAFDYNLPDCEYNLGYEKYIYRSKDEGRTWQEDKNVKKLFDKYDFQKIEFLDKDHALGFNRKESAKKIKGQIMAQGTYYILRNMQIVDSLKTPADLHYDSNYNNYWFSAKGDTVLLGSWSYDEYHSAGKTKYFQPFLKKVNNKWKFHVEEKIYSRPVPETKKSVDSIKEYQNFKLINKQQLVFKNGSGILKLKQGISDEMGDYGYFIIEKGNQIYLINRGYYGSVYVSFDQGTHWYLYPIPLEPKGNYQFLDIDKQYEISYFSNEWMDGTEREIRKIFYKFSLK